MEHARIIAATIASVALTVVLAGCATVPPGITPATTEQVASCRYVDDVRGFSALYGVFAGAGVDRAKADAMEKAKAIGATHIVWHAPYDSMGNTGAAGRAFRC